VSLTWQQPLVNVARTAIEALAAVLGGTQSLHTNSYDEALALPTEDAVRLALRTQQVIAHETGVVNTIDPLGGSYHVEAQTNRLEAAAYELFRRIDGSAAWSRDRAEHASARDREPPIATSRRSGRRRIVVGVNRYRSSSRGDPILSIDPERKQTERLTVFGTPRPAAVSRAWRSSRRRGGAVQPDACDRRRSRRRHLGYRDAWRTVQHLASNPFQARGQVSG
jgi:methylmalonyl-CoA mutase N-terminal domain/subunit